ncbi:MAG: polysaccharide ABC transporter ATP-binding protein [Smithellaceae bacterium]|jgi:lipopolysaccharide transport system ATP-binding protein|nr:ATP-binding cassette domain-containing protein [Syntrophaceae bacterium]
MGDVVIKAEGLGKKYTIGHQNQTDRYMALRDVLMQNAKSLWNKTKDLVTGKPLIQGDTLEEVWALRDVSFEVRRGEAVGIIGRNGAGKSTLLKVLSRITEPTAGRITIKGRVASLLEVGTGFHPELTGRENIYLNGTILGMTRAEIKRKFDEIVAFAEIEKYLDTPVKRYSSGMYVRLAFAVAAHLEPEILVVDEVLAVGDAQFQKKCLGKMGDVNKEGRTVLFVSHNIGAIKSLCSKGLLLVTGCLEESGDINNVVSKYLSTSNNFTGCIKWTEADAPGDQDLKLISLATTRAGYKETHFDDDAEIDIEIEIIASKNLPNATIGMIITNQEGQPVLHVASNLKDKSFKIKKGINKIRYSIPSNLLLHGQYSITIAGVEPNLHTYFRLVDAICFILLSKNEEINRYAKEVWKGVLNPKLGTWYYLK